MKNISSIVLKGNDKGIRLIIAKDACIADVLLDLDKIFSNTNYKNQSNNEIKLSFEGKLLTMDEKNLILNTLLNKGINIQTDYISRDNFHNKTVEQQEKNGLFYVGNLKNGQILETKDSIIVIGNVEQGAAIYSEGNIIITGFLYGYAKAKFVYSYMSGRNM